MLSGGGTFEIGRFRFGEVIFPIDAIAATSNAEIAALAEALAEVSTYVTPPIRWQILRAWSVDTGAFPCFESEDNTSRFVRRSEAQPTRTIGME